MSTNNYRTLMSVKKNGSSNPLYAHTLSEFIESGKNRNLIPTYDRLCLQESHGNITYVVNQLLTDYIQELRALSEIIVLSKEESKRYNYNPKLLSADIYGTTDLYYLILMLNEMASIKEFTNIESLYMLSSSNIIDALSSIVSSESKDVLLYNTRHT